MEHFISILNNDNFKLLLIVIVLDLFLGILRAIREKSLNSCIGIDGMIRKVAMIVVIIFLIVIGLLKLWRLWLNIRFKQSQMNLKMQRFMETIFISITLT